MKKLDLKEYIEIARTLLKTEKGQQLLGMIIGNWLVYMLYRKLGAPRWAALGLTDISSRVEMFRTFGFRKSP